MREASIGTANAQIVQNFIPETFSGLKLADILAMKTMWSIEPGEYLSVTYGSSYIPPAAHVGSKAWKLGLI